MGDKRRKISHPALKSFRTSIGHTNNQGNGTPSGKAHLPRTVELSCEGCFHAKTLPKLVKGSRMVRCEKGFFKKDIELKKIRTRFHHLRVLKMGMGPGNEERETIRVNPAEVCPHFDFMDWWEPGHKDNEVGGRPLKKWKDGEGDER